MALEVSVLPVERPQVSLSQSFQEVDNVALEGRPRSLSRGAQSDSAVQDFGFI